MTQSYFAKGGVLCVNSAQFSHPGDNTMTSTTSRFLRPLAACLRLLLLFLACVALAPQASAVGTWTALKNKPPKSVELVLLLTDGTVMAANYDGNAWYKLTPDIHGSYVNGKWTTLASMHDTRLYYSSDVLPDGRVFVAGGEYGTGGSKSEVYDPFTNAWTQTPQAPVNSFIDSISELLPNGNVMVGPVSPSTASTLFYNPTSNTWSVGPSVLHGQDEVAWVKLPDGSIFTIDGQRTSTERYIPASNQWIVDTTVPVAMYDGNGEVGPNFLLPNGKLFCVGGTGHTAIYTPSGTSSPGSWVVGPDVPGGNGMPDAPGAMMPSGVIVMATGPAGTLTSPTSFYEYDPVANGYTQLNGPTGTLTLNTVPYVCNMLDLPDGNILFTSNSTQLYIYTPSGAPLAAGQPTITMIAANGDGSFTLTGTLLNGICEGAAYGDDAQMATNYPIVRMTDAANNVYYARTTNWSSHGVMTGSTPVTTQFTLPLNLPAGTYSVVVVANGNASTTVSLTIPVNPDSNPTVATAAAASPSTVTGSTTNLSVLGDDDGGEANLTYTWTITTAPTGVVTPAFSVNNSNAAKNTTVTFFHAGAYSFTVTITDTQGLSATSAVNVAVNQTESSAVISPNVFSLTSGQTQQIPATANDQFGVAMSVQPIFTYALVSGGGSVNSTGRYTSPGSGTLATVSATHAAFQDTATIGVVTAPWVSTDIGPPALAGTASDSSGVFTITVGGADIFGTADDFHYVYRTLTGDGTIIARIPSIQNTDPFAKAGLMMRNSTANNDQEVMMTLTPGQGAALFARATSTGSTTDVQHTQGFAPPYWLKLVRSGNTFTGYRSPDGVTWTQHASTTVTMTNSTILVGLALCSHNAAALNTTTFDKVDLSPTVATPAAANPSTVTAATTALSVLGADADGGGESNLTYSWAATTVPPGAATPAFSINGTNAAKNTIATMSKAGAYIFTVTITDSGTLTVQSAVNVTVNQTPSSISVSPASVGLGSRGTQQFTATAKDQFGTALTTQPGFTWSLTGSGSVTTSGFYTAPFGSGTATVKATSGVTTGTGGVTVTNATPIVNTAAQATPAAPTGFSTALAVLGADSDGGGEANLSYTWVATTVPAGAPTPTFSPNGTNSAKNTTASFYQSGLYTFTATITDSGGLSTTSAVNVTVTLTPVNSWLSQKFGANAGNPAIAGLAADPDGDGLNNLLEYAFNSNPLAGEAAVFPTVEYDGVNVTITYQRNLNASDLTWQVQETTDFTSWNPASVTESILSTSGDTQTVQDAVPIGSAGLKFLRLQVSMP